MSTLSIIIPVFNEQNTISKILELIFKANTLGLRKEIIIIDDGSTDETKRIIQNVIIKQRRQKKAKKNNTTIVLLHNVKNEGKTKAIKKGFEKSTGDTILIQDADGEYDPSDYSDLLKPILDYGADVVYGSRFNSAKPRRVVYFWNTVANKALTTISNIFTNFNLTDMETGFKVFNRDIADQIIPTLSSNNFGFEPEFTAKLAKIPGIKLYEVGISYFGRTYVEGKKIRFVDAIYAFWYIIKFFIINNFNFFTSEAILEPIVRFIRFSKAEKILKRISTNSVLLDIGCGPEYRLYKFLNQQKINMKQYIGIDPTLKKDAVINNIKLYKNAIDKKIGLPSSSCDFVTAFAVLEHVDNPTKLVEESIRILKKGGYFIATTPTPKSKPILEFLSFKLKIISSREIAEHKTYFDKESLSALVSTKNRKIIKGSHEYFEFGLNNCFILRKY